MTKRDYIRPELFGNTIYVIIYFLIINKRGNEKNVLKAIVFNISNFLINLKQGFVCQH